MVHDLSSRGQDALAAAWAILREWLQVDLQGQEVFQLLVSEPDRGTRALAARLEQTGIPGFTAAVSGGMLGKLVQIASAEAVHVHQDRERSSSNPARPAELPPDIAAFTGRVSELEQLTELVGAAEASSSTPIIVVDGPPGVGKSALTIHFAHEISHRYADGHLYVNLQGATPGLAPLNPIDVLGRFLRALGMDGKDIPVDTGEAATRFRSLTSGRRILIMLDNAASAMQARQMIPAGTGCAVLITSREVLSTLDGAAHLHLSVLSATEAVSLLEKFAGKERVAAEPGATATLARQCGLLPLALRIAGARLAARPSWSLQALAARLTDERARLNELQLGDLAVRASFGISYEALSAIDGPTEASCARTFRLLGLLEGPDVSVDIVAALIGGTHETTDEALERLVDAQLLESPSPGRYQMHDLLRLFAREHAFRDDAQDDRRLALHRTFEFLLARACGASTCLQPTDPRRTAQKVNGEPGFATRTLALDWLEAERPNLVAAARQAASAPDQFGAIATQIADALFWFCHLRAYPRDLEVLSQLALATAQRLGDREGEGQSLHNLCIANLRLRRFEEAVRHGNRGLEIRRSIGDLYGEGRTLDALGRVHYMVGRFDEAVEYGEQSLSIARRIQDRYSESAVLCNLVPIYQAMQRYAEAIACGQESLSIRTELGDRYGEGRMRMSLGVAYQASGRLDEAIQCFEESLTVFRDIGDRYDEGRSLFQLAVAHELGSRPTKAIEFYESSITVRRQTADRFGEGESLHQLAKLLHSIGDKDAARMKLDQALVIFEELGVPNADEIRTLLAT
ncbi:tetratricopeptide repeat protein [Streptomyces sp. NPDC005492]|uniref:tetratricopeptide repeat protein n=1 Tax=Streptomyces sp. NPDC005492 TaxID=3156883 RepID=UPI0033AB47BE